MLGEPQEGDAPKSLEKTSSLLRRILSGLTEVQVPVGILLYRLRRRSFGGVLFFLALLSLIPGIAILSGVIIIVLGVQLSLGFKTPKFIDSVNELNLNVAKLSAVLNKTIPHIQTLEKYVKPRWAFLTTAPITILIGLLVSLLAVLVLIPLPFTGLLPVFSLLLFSFGLLERDGLVILAGIVMSVLSATLGLFIIKVALNSLG